MLNWIPSRMRRAGPALSLTILGSTAAAALLFAGLPNPAPAAPFDADGDNAGPPRPGMGWAPGQGRGMGGPGQGPGRGQGQGQGQGPGMGRGMDGPGSGPGGGPGRGPGGGPGMGMGPGGPMHQGPGFSQGPQRPAVALSGKVERYNLSPRGTIDALLIRTADKLVQVNLPPDLGGSIALAAPLNAAVQLTARPELGLPDHPVYRLASLTTADNKRIEIDGRPRDVTVEGVIKHLNFSPHGEVNGLLLESGEFIHLGPDGANAIEAKIGQKVTVEGRANPGPLAGGAIEAQRVNGKELPRPRHQMMGPGPGMGGPGGGPGMGGPGMGRGMGGRGPGMQGPDADGPGPGPRGPRMGGPDQGPDQGPRNAGPAANNPRRGGAGPGLFGPGGQGPADQPGPGRNRPNTSDTRPAPPPRPQADGPAPRE